ncbi:hypothetical protein L218DRAFT_1020783 [Marasmius fiardii PR-910]|nr:hypothetical protein L218DRAFT_1020783 [Marasmius fiardii PR-910]
MGQDTVRILGSLHRYTTYHLYTLLLFTWTDFKTIVLPVTVFACASAPLYSITRLFQAGGWIWLHLLLCNVSNQARSSLEDQVNRSWRPLPSQRLTEDQCFFLRWISVATCLFVSWTCFGTDVLYATCSLLITTVLYDEHGLSQHYIGKNLCAIGGYVSFQIGATKIVGCTRQLDSIAWSAICISGILIFTTIHAQDFADEEGDRACGRITFPIYMPEFSRQFTFMVIFLWSLFLSWSYSLGLLSSVFLVMLGYYSGYRYYRWRNRDSDRKSYRIFNAWLITVYLLPIHARTNWFRF